MKLYDEAKANLKGRIGEFDSDPVQAQALYDFIFKMETGLGNMSDYLSRFAALGLVNEKFSGLLGFATTMKTQSLAGLPFTEKLHTAFENVLEFINNRATATFGGQQADDKLQSLVNQLVSIEQAKRTKISQAAIVAVDTFEKGFDVVKTNIIKFTEHPFFKQNTNGFVRLAATATNMVASDRVSSYFDHLQHFMDKGHANRNGILMGLISEARGSHDLNLQAYKLNRISKHNEGMRKDLITQTQDFIAKSFANGGKDLTTEMNTALSYAVLRTDMQSLMTHYNGDIKEIEKLVRDPVARKAAIADMEQKLSGFKHAAAYMNGARVLGLYLGTNEVGAENLRLNADNIAAMFGTEHKGKVAAADITAATPVIDALATLHGINYLKTEHVSDILKVFDAENARTDGGHGIEMMLKMHTNLQEQSQAKLFQSSGALRMKGYTPEAYNPYIRLQVVNDEDTLKTPDGSSMGKTAGDLLREKGYQPGVKVQQDAADVSNTQDKMRIFKLRDGGMVQYLTGIFSYTGMRNRGTTMHDGNMDLLSPTGAMNVVQTQNVGNRQKAKIQQQDTTQVDPQKNAKNNNYLVPVFNANGDVTNYRYMMNAQTKDNLLERDNNASKLLGVMAGSIFDKEETAIQNERAVQALHDQFKADYGLHSASYMEVGPNVADKEARETYAMLPQSTKDAIKKIWGTDTMKVRYDLMDINFGYRKQSIASPFTIPEEERGNFQKAYVQLLEALMGKKAGLYVRRFEDGWQEVVREVKDTLVVKSGITLLGNEASNLSELIWFGVPMVDIWRHRATATRGVVAYRRESKQLFDLERQVALKQYNGRDVKDIKDEIVKLKDSLANNPIREMVDQGLMPTIVEDVSEDEDQYSYKSMMSGKIDEVIGNLNPHVLKASKTLLMAHDTPLYKVLAYGTQISDFVARYTLMEHLKNRAENPMSGDALIQMVSDAFVNYDVPSHRDVQYANDMGLVYFTKYYLRIQKVIALLYRDNPGRAMMLLTAGHFLDFIPMLQHSQILHRVGNPFSTGAFEAFNSFGEMATIQGLMSPFR